MYTTRSRAHKGHDTLLTIDVLYTECRCNMDPGLVVLLNLVVHLGDKMCELNLTRNLTPLKHDGTDPKGRIKGGARPEFDVGEINLAQEDGARTN